TSRSLDLAQRDSLPLGFRVGQWYRGVQEHQPRLGILKLWADAYGTGVAFLALGFIFTGERLDLAFESSQAAARGSLPRTKACRRRRIHRPRRTILHCGLPSLVPRRRFRSLSRAVRLAM